MLLGMIRPLVEFLAAKSAGIVLAALLSPAISCPALSVHLLSTRAFFNRPKVGAERVKILARYVPWNSV